MKTIVRCDTKLQTHIAAKYKPRGLLNAPTKLPKASLRGTENRVASTAASWVFKLGNVIIDVDAQGKLGKTDTENGVKKSFLFLVMVKR